MISLALLFAALAILTCTVAASFSGHLSHTNASGLCAIGSALLVISSVIDHSLLTATGNAALCAWNLHEWWRGGGDNTRRRLKRAAERFRPVRRTAPAN